MRSLLFFMGLLAALSGGAQKIDRAFIDKYLEKTTASFNCREPKVYFINNQLCCWERVDDLLRFWSIDTISSIAAIDNGGIWAVFISGTIDMRLKCANPYKIRRQ